MCMPESLYEKLDSDKFIKIGSVLNKDNTPVISIIDGDKTESITKNNFETESYNHFKQTY